MQGAMILMIGTMVVKIVSMIFKIPISNMLGGTGYSYFTNAYEIFNLISTIATAGFPVAVSKWCPKTVSRADTVTTAESFASPVCFF